ncbi:magnesium-transporting ATPase (P-type) [Arthrobacter pigmenti]|uniref:Magnesium-transporting ATPase (P-type) n=1 Tax=Arthrobacter pigmenti TaxID=271432 RepID=A0A846RSR9_9MICC|nr:hypothetical protein [Arthrobacter pigmenti]NJC23227.1 magnesium-transporting ATPase (P-type) [Arthrobacter pigmenti]
MARKPRPTLPPRPLTIRVAIAMWALVSVLFLIAAVSFLVSATLQEIDRAGLIGLGVLMAGIAVIQLVLVLGLMRGRRGARELLTTIGFIVGVPIIVRRTPGLSVICVVMLLSIVLMWLPTSSAWFQKIHPKPQNKWVRLASRTASPFRKK